MKQTTATVLGFFIDKIRGDELRIQLLEVLKSEGILDLSSHKRDELWALWCNQKCWKRGYKRRVGNETSAYFNSDGSFITSYDDNDGHRSVLTGMESTVTTGYNRCVIRQFIHSDEEFSNYSIYIVTDPNDEKIVGWHLHEDR